MLVAVIGATTAVNSLWEDLADYTADLKSGARTIPIVFGPRHGMLLTIGLGYTLIPLMLLVGIMFNLPMIFYATLMTLTSFVSLRLWFNRNILGSQDTNRLLA